MDDKEMVIGVLFAALVVFGVAFDRSRPWIRHARFKRTLDGFRSDRSWREKTFHQELKAYLEKKLKGPLLDKVISEGGLTGTTTRLDLHAIYGNVDYLITVKKNLDAQKLKTLTGEAQDILAYVRPTAARKTCLIVMLYGTVKASGDDHFKKLGDQLRALGKSHPAVDVHISRSEDRAN